MLPNLCILPAWNHFELFCVWNHFADTWHIFELFVVLRNKIISILKKCQFRHSTCEISYSFRICSCWWQIAWNKATTTTTTKQNKTKQNKKQKKKQKKPLQRYFIFQAETNCGYHRFLSRDNWPLLLIDISECCIMNEKLIQLSTRGNNSARLGLYTRK